MTTMGDQKPARRIGRADGVGLQTGAPNAAAGPAIATAAHGTARPKT